jgi:predicted metal-binding protein
MVQNFKHVKAAKSSSQRKGLSNKGLVEIAEKETHVKKAVIVLPKNVATAGWVRLKCQYGCDGYGQSLTCPPFTPTPDQMRNILDCYRRAILIHFDTEADVKAIVVKLERKIFLSGAWKAFGLGAGPCYFCNECAIESGQCRHAERARPAMEACGIDVFTTARRAGFEIEVVKTTSQCPNYFGLVLVD